MSCFNFIIMKVNGADVSNLPYEEAVQLFLNAEDPILVEVRRRCFDESNKLNIFNYDTHKSPTLAVISSSNTPNVYDGVEFCRISAASAAAGVTSSSTIRTVKHSLDVKPTISSISCQTDLSAFDSESKEIIIMKGDSEFNSGTFFRKKPENPSTNVDTIDGCLRTEFDIEEITLKKSQSAENLGFTISYSMEDFSGSESGSDECVDECKDIEGECNLNDFAAQRCKIYVSDIVPNSLADRDGRLRQGDRILQINRQNVLEKVDPNKLLTENKYSVTILVSRYAYAGEDDFLDSAVYCDDKECQDGRHLSSICECEQNTFSSKSSIEQSEQKSSTPTTVTNIYPILPIAVENVSDLFNHASIKAQLESVNKEITLLNSQISIMKLQQSSENQSSAAGKQSSPLKAKERQEKPSKTVTTKAAAEPPPLKSKPDIEVEHIYETIPEDTESDAYYCSPYEGVNEMRVEQWLKSIGCTKSHIQSVSERNKTDTTSGGLHPVASRLQKHNPILDDYDNSSSAYNTGGSCNSALLPLDQQSKPALVHQIDRYNSKKLPSKCKNALHALNKPIHSEGKTSETLTTSGKQLRSTCRNLNISVSDKQQQSSCVNRRNPVPSTPVSLASHCPTDIDSDGHSTLVAKSSGYRMCQYKAVEEYKEEGLSEMVWKVKRRPDGTRYIVRRVIKKCPPPEKMSPDDQQPDSASAIGFKRQVQKLKDRRHRQKNPATPSKEKHHAQHWLV